MSLTACTWPLLLALHPEFFARAAPEMRPAGLDGFFERRAVHPRHHQHAAGFLLLDDGRNQPVGVKFQLVVKAHAPIYHHKADRDTKLNFMGAWVRRTRRRRGEEEVGGKIRDVCEIRDGPGRHRWAAEYDLSNPAVRSSQKQRLRKPASARCWSRPFRARTRLRSSCFFMSA